MSVGYFLATALLKVRLSQFQFTWLTSGTTVPLLLVIMWICPTVLDSPFTHIYAFPCVCNPTGGLAHHWASKAREAARDCGKLVSSTCDCDEIPNGFNCSRCGPYRIQEKCVSVRCDVACQDMKSEHCWHLDNIKKRSMLCCLSHSMAPIPMIGIDAKEGIERSCAVLHRCTVIVCQCTSKTATSEADS